MHVFRDLYVRGTPGQIAATINDAERSLSDGWSRDAAEEVRIKTLAIRAEPVYCFSCTELGERPAANVFLIRQEPELLCASNIVPRRKHQLSHVEYNGILEEFCNRFIRPAASRTGVVVELTSTQADLEHWLPPEAAAKLRTFSASANKGTGAGHPDDRERWNDFVMAAHQGRSRLCPSTLRRWLVAVEGWPVEVADLLVIEYEFGRELLSYAEGKRRSA